MVATYQKVKNSLPFQWPLNSFHCRFIDLKQSMFTFALALFAAIDIYLFIFKLFLLFAERGRRNMEESIHNKNHWPQLHVSGVECQIDRFACFAAYFSSFPKENAFQSLEEDLWTINRKTEFPDLSLSLTVPKIFPDFLKNSLTFPRPWKIFVFPWLFPDRGNQDITKNNSLRKINVTRSQYSKHIGHVCRCSNTTLTKKMLFGKSTCRRPYKRDPWNRY